MSSAWIAITAGCAAGIAAGLAGLLLVKRWDSCLYRRVAGLLGAVAIVNLANAIGLLRETDLLFWRQVALTVELIQPALLIYVGMAFVNPTRETRETLARWPACSIGAVGVLLGAITLDGQFIYWRIFENGEAAVVLGFWGRVPYGFVVIAMAVGVAYLEVVLRASREPFRHKLKFIVVGLGGLAGYQIYQASQMLLFSVWQVEHVAVSSAVTLAALALIIYGLGRSRLQEVLVHAYVSHQALVGSVTFIVIGLYLLAVGAVGTWLRETNQSLGVGLSVVVVFGAIVGLVIAAFSKTVRAGIRRLVARNFHRSKYDYRAQWLHITEVFQQAADRDSIMDRLLDVLIKTFPTTHVSIWAFHEADRRFCRVRSMTGEAEPEPIDLSHPIVVELGKQDGAVLVESRATEAQVGLHMATDTLGSSGAALCFPIRAQGRVMAFIALGPQLHSEPYGTDDEDLLRGIAHHVGMLLVHASLAEDRRASVEMEALHRFSLFCLHDLKNLAARLSLVAQNAERHGRDPAFQESAMRTVKDTSLKMTALISKLSPNSVKQPQTSRLEPVDLSALVDEVVAPIRRDPAVRLSLAGALVPSVMAVRDQIHQVLLNVVLNAKQALSENGEISIALAQVNGSVVVTVEDTGNGIPRERLELLFRPAQSGRPGGLGIGLYQCKQIVEAHQGTIQVRSKVGTGTQVRIELPLCPAAGHREETGMPSLAMSVHV